MYFLDKTFGEIRQAFEAGKMVVLVRISSWETGSYGEVSILSNLTYNIDANSAYGSVYFGQDGYSAETPGAPYTLEALDATYPYMAS